MLENYQYLISLLIVGFLSMLYLWKKGVLKEVLKTIPVFIIIGIIWDSLGVRLKWWEMKKVIGIYFIGLPLEEYLFFIFVPMMVISVYLHFKKTK